VPSSLVWESSSPRRAQEYKAQQAGEVGFVSPAFGFTAPVLAFAYAKLGNYQHEGYRLCQKDLNARSGRLRCPALLLEPAVDFSLGFLAAAAVPLLDLADEHFGVALHLVDLVVGELAPLLSDLALQLHPLALEDVEIHRCSSYARHAGGFIDAIIRLSATPRFRSNRNASDTRSGEPPCN